MKEVIVQGDEIEAEVLDIYVDGSFIHGHTKWAIIGYEGKKERFRARGVLVGEICSMRQIGGELKAAMEAVLAVKKLGKKARIFYDYKGIACWTGLVEEKWQAKNEWTQKYKEFMAKNKDHIEGFVKVKSHTGDERNEKVDEWAKGA